MSQRWEVWKAERSNVYWLERAAGRHEVAGYQRRVASTEARDLAEAALRLFEGSWR